MKVLIFTTILIIVCNLTSGQNYNESCSEDVDCDFTQGLLCNKGFCSCSSESTFYSQEQKRCLIKIGRRCTPQIENDSNEVNPSYLTDFCPSNASCKKLRKYHWCRCEEGFNDFENGTVCKPIVKYGEFCSQTSDCQMSKSNTECIEGHCRCPFRDQYYDPVKNNCVSLAGKNCSVPHISPCVDNAECLTFEVRTGFTTNKGVKKIRSKSITQCICNQNYSMSNEGSCLGSANTKCSRHSLCNKDRFLHCIDGRCKCRNPLHQMIDENSGSCVNLINSYCESVGPKCVENSSCQNGKCICNKNYSETSEKTCALNYKEQCQPFECNSDLGLACVAGTCQCFDSNLNFDENSGSCIKVTSTVQQH